MRREFGAGAGEPGGGRLPVDGGVRAEQAAARRGVLVAEDHARAAAGGGAGRGESGRTAADDQHVAMAVLVLVGVGVRRARAAAHPGGVADHVLVAQPPAGRGRPHERLVVEARREQPREHVVERADVEAHRRPAVLARGDETGVELDLRGARVGLGARAARELHQRVGLVGARGGDAARPVVLEAAGDEMHAVGEQRRGERVARAALVADAVELERERRRAVDEAAFRQAERLRHARASFPVLRRGAGFTLPARKARRRGARSRGSRACACRGAP